MILKPVLKVGIDKKNYLKVVLQIIFFSSLPAVSGAQNIDIGEDDPSQTVEQQLEDITESSNDVEPEDDSYLQDLHELIKEPINVNTADKVQLEQLEILTPVQIANFLSYRKLLGSLISIYELQAIPDWDIELIRKLKPFIMVSNKIAFLPSVNKRLKNGEHTILFRSSQVLERSRGYLVSDSASSNYYQGSPQRILIRYKYRYKNFLQYGFTAEKDPGEQFFKGAQKNGFDFYSFHFALRDVGIIKALVIGDFNINLGQGLIQWQGLAFGKGSGVINIKRQAEKLKPYNSSGEIVFNRGIGITMGKNKWSTTAFISFRKIDANLVSDTMLNIKYVTSLQTSGYHRTQPELEDKHIQGQLTVGGNMSYTAEKFDCGFNVIHYNFEYPIRKQDYLYNIYALKGNSLSDFSFDYGYTIKNTHLFGEVAVDEGANMALLSGILISPDSHIDLSLLYRHIAPGYKSLYSNAFTENTSPVNESGFYAGLSVSPSPIFKINAYADFFHFPWLKYRVNAPSRGQDYFAEVVYKPNKKLEVYGRYRSRNKPVNFNPSGLPISFVVNKPKQNLRGQVSYILSRSLKIRARVELCWYDMKQSDSKKGILVFNDLIFKPYKSSWAVNLRLQYFNTGNYDSRLYAFENDVLYSYTIPVFYDKGYRYYLNIRYKPGKRLSFWTRFAQTIYSSKKEIGNGLDLIKGNVRSEIKFQGILTF
jgi:hypothetical protein